MPSEILKQLRTLREGVAEALRKDPRYLTLTALDKSIAEITGVLASAGLLPPEAAVPVAPVHFEPSAPAQPSAGAALAPTAVASGASSAAAVAPASVAAAAVPTPAVVPTQASYGTPVAAPSIPASAVAHPGALSATAPAAVQVGPNGTVKKKKKSLLKPFVETAAVIAAGGLAAEVISSEFKKKPAASHAKSPADDGSKSAAKSDDEDDPADDRHLPEDVDHQTGAGDTDPDEAEDEADQHADAEHAQEHGDAAADPAGIVPAGKASGYVPMAAKAGAAQYQPSIAVKFGKPPAKVDLRPLMTPIEDQGDTNSCVANAVAGAYQYWIKKTTKQEQDISRLFVYYNARWRDGSQDKDEGSVIQLAMEGLQKFGACFEKEWPFDPHLILKKPAAEAYKDGAAFRVQDMAQVPLKLEAWKQALAEGKPIVFGCALFDSFDECSERGGVVPMPSPEDVARAKHSGHSMCAVGYNDGEKVFIVRNSWGTEWGDKGYCYMPYDYLMNPKFNDGDCWVFVPKVPSQPPREVWSDTTTPVTNDGKGVDFPIAAFSIADYEHLAIDLFQHVRRPFNTTILEDYGHYVSAVSRNVWSELESFDFRTYLASAAALTGVATIATEAYLSESTSETVSTSETSLMSEDDEADEDDTYDAEDQPFYYSDDSDDDDADDDTE